MLNKLNPFLKRVVNVDVTQHVKTNDITVDIRLDNAKRSVTIPKVKKLDAKVIDEILKSIRQELLSIK